MNLMIILWCLLKIGKKCRTKKESTAFNIDFAVKYMILVKSGLHETYFLYHDRICVEEQASNTFTSTALT